MLTGEDQHIEKKTLDDYYSHIKAGNDSSNPYDFSENELEMVKHLRKHCQDTKSMMWFRFSTIPIGELSTTLGISVTIEYYYIISAKPFNPIEIFSFMTYPTI